MKRVNFDWLLAAALIPGHAWAVPGRHFAASEWEHLATRWLKENTAHIRCDARHFIFGVGYIDGSYMERIFYVAGGGDHPAISVEFRATQAVDPVADGVTPEDGTAIPFVMELEAPSVLHATPVGEGWEISDQGWESALRFKYTSWFGLISSQDDTWRVEWQGYRRPMLPESLIANTEEICSRFAAY